MKSLSSKTYQCGVTIQGLTTLSGTVYLTGITNTASWDHVIVGTTAQGQIYTRTYAQFMGDVATGISLSSYVTGSGTTNYLSKFTGGSALGNSQIFDNGTNVGIGTTSPTAKLEVYGSAESSPSYTTGGIFRVNSTATNALLFGTLSGSPFAGYIQSGGSNKYPLSLNPEGGNVGIGTTSPAAVLHTLGTDIVNIVQSSTSVSYTQYYNSSTGGGGTSDGLTVGNNGLDAYIWQRESANLRFGTSNTEAICITSTQNVGIGTSSPNVTLEANGIIRSDRVGVASQYVQINGGDAVGPFITAAGAAKVLTIQNNSTTSSDIYFDQAVASTYQFKQATVTKMILDASGNVGIGSVLTEPYALSDRLRVKGGAIQVMGGDVANTRYRTLIASPLDFRHFYIDVAANTANQVITYFGKNINGTETDFMTIKDGNVGIGTTSPAAKLDVYGGDIYINYNQYLGGGTAYNSIWNRILIYNGSTGDMEITMHNTNWYLRHNANATFAGNVGIGTTSPNSYAGYTTLTLDHPSSGGIIDLEKAGTRIGSLNVNDGNFNIVNPIASDMLLFTSFQERLRITSTGNVGIGTSSPSYPLHVNGTTYITSPTYTGYLMLSHSANGAVRVGNQNGDYMQIGPSNVFTFNRGITATAFTVTGAGTLSAGASYQGTIFTTSNFIASNTGINYGLQIISSYSNNGAGGPNYGRQLRLSDTLAVANIQLDFTNLYIDTTLNYTGTTTTGIVRGIHYNPTLTSVVGVTHRAIEIVTGDVIFGSTSGNVGIGTANPLNLLHVSQPSANTIFRLGNNASYDQFIYFNGGNDWSLGMDYSNSNAFVLSNASSIGTNDRLVVTTGGNVGIGTTSPSARLHISGSTDATQRIIVDGSGNNSSLHLNYNGSNVGFISSYQNSELNIGTSISAFVNFYTNNTERMRITSAGNVGIGTTAPSGKFDIAHDMYSGAGNGVLQAGAYGSINFKGASSQGTTTTQQGITWQVDSYGGSTNYGVQAQIAVGNNGNVGTFMGLFTSDNYGIPPVERIRIQYNGNVGIGTSSPGYKLQVNGDGNGLYVLGANTAPYTQTIASFVYGGNGNSINIENQGGKASIQARAGGSTMDLLLNPAGSNVVIGTTTPFTIGGTAKVSIYADAPSTYGLSSTDAVYLRRYGVGEYQFQTTASGGNNGNLSLQSYGGSVGIGTTSPAQKLDVAGGDIILSSNATYIRSKDASGNTPRMFGINPSNDTYIGPIDPYAGGAVFYGVSANVASQTFYTGATARLHITSGGNVGIGTASPSEKLDVYGAIKLSGQVANVVTNGIAHHTNGYVYFTGGTAGAAMGNDSYSSAIYAVDNGSLELYAGSANRLHITSGGNIGIGTTAPTNRLQIGSVGSSGYGGNDIAIGNGTQVMAFYQSATVSSWYTNTSFSLMPSGSGSVGNVGIGTLTPSTKLDVSGVITATGGNSTNWNTAYGWGNHASASYVPQARTLTINGTSYDLSANRTWTIATTTAAGSDTQVQYNSSGSLAGASALTYNSTTNRVGINQASPGYDLDVNGQVRVQDKLRVGTGNGVVHMSSTATINASATTIVWAQNVSVGMCAFIEYYILNSNSLTDQRAGTIMVTWNQSGTPTITHTETTTPDIGATTTVNFTSSLVGSDARINAVNSSANPYTMVMSFKYF